MTMRSTAASSTRLPDERSISTFSTVPSALIATVTSTLPNSSRWRASSGKLAVPTRSIFWRHWSTYSAYTTLWVRAPTNLRLGSSW